MKNLVIIFLAIISVISLKGQNPVNWSYSSKKVADNTFEVHIKATIQSGWHLYSQTQPEEAIAIPTNIQFTKHPLIKLSGKIKENGKLEKHKDATLGIEQWQYSMNVEFIQTISLKTNVKTNISGNIEYQVCTDEKCLPPKVVEFSVRLE